MRSCIAVALGVLSSLAGSPLACADDVRGTRGGPLVRERELSMEVRLDRGHATVVVQRLLENAGPRHDQAEVDLFIPLEAVATGLRTRGSRGAWFDGDLLEAEAAAKRYQELTGLGGYYPKDPALLSWREQGHLALQVFPLAPGDRKLVEYTLELPTEYRDGRHHLKIPLPLLSAEPRVVVHPAQPQDKLLLDGQPLAPGSAVSTRPPDGAAAAAEEALIDLALAPTNPPLLSGALAVKPVARQRVLTRYRLEAAPRLSSVPRTAQIVLVFDGSRSLTGDDQQAAIAAARAYLGHFAEARVEVLVFDREVRARHGQFVPVARALGDLESLTIQPRNGSQVDQALAKADTLLAALPAGPARRVVLFTDLLTRSALQPDKLRGVLKKSGALLHIVEINPGTPALERKEAPENWSLVARSTGGLLWEAVGTDEAGSAAEMARVFEELARPIRLHSFDVVAPGMDNDPSRATDLHEGACVTALAIAAREVPWVKATGALWTQPVSVTLAPDTAETRLWSALAFGTSLVTELTEPEMMTLAMHGRAVSPVTSYLAVEPGVRPSTEGFDRGGGGVGGLGDGSGSISLACKASRDRKAFDPQRYLEESVAAAWSACHGEGQPVSVTLETTLAEIVDIPALGADAGGDAWCLREAIWTLELPDDFRAEHQSWTVTL
jgi:hypothetical protein